MRLCPQCHELFEPSQEFCPQDGTPLVFQNDSEASTSDTAIAQEPAQGTALPLGNKKRPPTESTPDELSGTVVGGVYRVLEKLGEGGMGVVYRVEHTNLKKQFAMKVLNELAKDHPDAAERFRQEAVLASRIDHDNIVDVITLDSTPQGHLFIAMELLKGDSLADRIGKGPMAVEQVLPVACQICHAVHAAHEAGIVHRDLKPENVFIVPRGAVEFVKILDFGISKLQEAEAHRVRITRTGNVLGTPLYMSPEQARGEARLDRRSDVYSLGVLLFEMLEGSPPFNGENYFQLIWQHTNADIPTMVKNERPQLEAVVRRAMAKDVDERYATMLELEADLLAAVPDVPRPAFLEAYSSGGPNQPRPTPAPSPVTAPRRPRWPLVATMAGGAVLTLAVLALALSGAIVAPPEEPKPSAAAASPTQEPEPAPEAAGAAETAVVSRTAEEGAAETTTPASQRVVLTVTSQPEGAQVFLGEQRLGSTPLQVERPTAQEPHTLRLMKRGFRTTTRQLVLDQDRSLAVTLKRRRQHQKGPGPSALPLKTNY
jgi:serine/threonine-protein kinase